MKKIFISCLFLWVTLFTSCANVESKPPVETIESSGDRVSESPVSEEPVELVVYSQLSSFYGEQEGWFAQVLLEKFNVKLILASYPSTEFDDLMESGNLGDILVFGSSGSDYQEAAKEGVLLDWEKNNLLADHGSYILKNMPKALEYNRNLTPEIGKVFGFGHNVAPSSDSFEEVIYAWDIRWDLYKRLGYPEVKDLEDLVTLFEDMKEICPVNEEGKETYAMSIWPDWDENMVMYVKTMASAYYGYDEFHLGLYDSDTGTFYGALEEDGPYLEMLKFFNTLYRKGLLDPDSETQTYDEMVEKMQSSEIFFSVFGYAGSLAYNTEEHSAGNKYMASLLPVEATPATYGMSVTGGNRVWTIGANTKHPELCMEIINWLCTPEGRLTYEYGPKGVIWDYDGEGNTYFTELGKACFEDRTTMMTGDYAGTYYSDGCPQINNTTWHINAENPDSNGESYNASNWKSNIRAPFSQNEQDWREHTGALTTLEYMKSKNCVVIPATRYEAPEKSEELQKVWEKVADCIVTESWNAIYAKSDAEYEKIVSKMIKDAKAYGYEECMTWCEQEAEKRHALEEEVTEE